MDFEKLARECAAEVESAQLGLEFPDLERIAPVIFAALRTAAAEALEFDAIEEFEDALDGTDWTEHEVVTRIERIRLRAEAYRKEQPRV